MVQAGEAGSADGYRPGILRIRLALTEFCDPCRLRCALRAERLQSPAAVTDPVPAGLAVPITPWMLLPSRQPSGEPDGCTRRALAWTPAP